MGAGWVIGILISSVGGLLAQILDSAHEVRVAKERHREIMRILTPLRVAEVYTEFKVPCDADAFAKFCQNVRMFHNTHPVAAMPIELFDAFPGGRNTVILLSFRFFANEDEAKAQLYIYDDHKSKFSAYMQAPLIDGNEFKCGIRVRVAADDEVLLFNPTNCPFAGINNFGHLYSHLDFDGLEFSISTASKPHDPSILSLEQYWYMAMASKISSATYCESTPSPKRQQSTSQNSLKVVRRAALNGVCAEIKNFEKIPCPCPIKGLRFPQLMIGTHPQNRRFGYARLSTVGQTRDSQLEQLRAAGCSTKIYRKKVTGAHNDLRELLKMLKHLAPGDVVTVTRIDRLARSTFDLFAIVKQIVDAKAQFRSLAEPWADTGTSTGRLMIAVLGGLADVERNLIRTRTAEGRSGRRSAAAHGPIAEIDRGTEGRGPTATGGGCYACRTRPQLPCGEEYDFATVTTTPTRWTEKQSLIDTAPSWKK
jgi:hypothetical protein